MASRSLDDLHPWVKAKAEIFLARAKAAGHPVLIYETKRTPEQQAQKVKQGLSQTLESAHLYGLAFDCVPFDPLAAYPRDEDLVLLWKAPKDIWQTLWIIGDSCGLDPLGMRGGEYLPWDRGHFQEPGWRLVKDLCGKS